MSTKNPHLSEQITSILILAVGASLVVWAVMEVGPVLEIKKFYEVEEKEAHLRQEFMGTDPFNMEANKIDDAEFGLLVEWVQKYSWKEKEEYLDRSLSILVRAWKRILSTDQRMYDHAPEWIKTDPGIPNKPVKIQAPPEPIQGIKSPEIILDH